MARQISIKPNARMVQGFGYDGDKLTAWETITVSTYASGTRRASHGRLDLSSNRMVFTQLTSPQDGPCPVHGVAHMLVQSAAEHELDVQAQEPLW
jgi:hypothetical protein